MIELTFTREELQHLYNVVLKSHLQVQQSVIDKIDYELVADRIFELLGDLECLDATLDEEWQNKLWYDDPEDEHTIAVKRNRELWTWATVKELEDLIQQLESK